MCSRRSRVWGASLLVGLAACAQPAPCDQYTSAFAREFDFSAFSLEGRNDGAVCPDAIDGQPFTGIVRGAFLSHPGDTVRFQPLTVGEDPDVDAWEVYTYWADENLDIQNVGAEDWSDQAPWYAGDDWELVDVLAPGSPFEVTLGELSDDLVEHCSDRSLWVQWLGYDEAWRFPPQGCFRNRPVLVRAVERDGTVRSSLMSWLNVEPGRYTFPLPPLQSYTPTLAAGSAEGDTLLRFVLGLPEDVLANASFQARGAEPEISWLYVYPDRGALDQDYRFSKAPVDLEAGTVTLETTVIGPVPTEVGVSLSLVRSGAYGGPAVDEAAWVFDLADDGSGGLTATLRPTPEL